MNELLNQLSEDIKSKVTQLYEKSYYKLSLDTNKYNTIIYHVINSIIEESNINITITAKFSLYYAALLYPCYNVDLNCPCDNNIRSILDSVKLPQFITDKDLFIAQVIEIVNINLNSNPTTITQINRWKYTLSDSINLTNISPKSLVQKALRLNNSGIPLYTRYTPYIKSRISISTLCCQSKKYNSFMEYIYHIALHQFTTSKSNNSYIERTKNQYIEKMVELCLSFGENEFVTEDKILEWGSKI